MVVYTYLCVCVYIYLFIYILQYIFLPSFLTILYKLKYINILVKQLVLWCLYVLFYLTVTFPLQCQTSGKWEVQYLCQHSVLFNMYTICQRSAHLLAHTVLVDGPDSWHVGGKQLVLCKGGIAGTGTDQSGLAHRIITHHHTLYGLHIRSLIICVYIHGEGPERQRRREIISVMLIIIELMKNMTKLTFLIDFHLCLT